MPAPTKILIVCPFCEKKSIPTFYHPKMRQFVSCRGNGHTSTQPRYVEEKYEILSDCPECGKSKKEIKAALKGETAAKESVPKCIICDRDIDASRSLCEECEKKYYKGKTAAGVMTTVEKKRII